MGRRFRLHDHDFLLAEQQAHAPSLEVHVAAQAEVLLPVMYDRHHYPSLSSWGLELSLEVVMGGVLRRQLLVMQPSGGGNTNLLHAQELSWIDLLMALHFSPHVLRRDQYHEGRVSNLDAAWAVVDWDGYDVERKSPG